MTGASKRPALRQIPLARVWPPRAGRCYVTMGRGQWDGILQAAYDVGYVLIELDGDEQPVGAYCGVDPERN
jgi:hypothetical protein